MDVFKCFGCTHKCSSFNMLNMIEYKCSISNKYLHHTVESDVCKPNYDVDERRFLLYSAIEQSKEDLETLRSSYQNSF